ncbi:MAG: bifunctional diguanylate cyclase/phosphodiesterase [Sulfuricaulis sp.]
MQLNRLSMRSSLVFALAVVGGLSAIFVFGSGDAYRNLAIEQQRATLAEQVRVRVGDLRREFELDSQRFTALATSNPGLVSAMEGGKSTALVHRLDGLFDRFDLITPSARLDKIQALDANMNSFAFSTRGASDAALDQSSCQSQLALSTKRKATVNTKLVTGVCVADKKIYRVMMLPVSDRAQSGYLMAAVDITPSLSGPENIFGMPVQLTFADGSVLQRSANWPSAGNEENNLVAEQVFGAIAVPRTILSIAVSRDIRSFREHLVQTERSTMGAALATILLVMLLMLWVLQKTSIKPMQTLMAQMLKVRSDKNHYGEHVVVAGNTEVAELGAGFNVMTTRLKELYESLESLAFTDPLTKLPNRTLFHERLVQAIDDAKRDYRPFALMLMDIDRFKDINDTLGHQVGDMLLQQVAARLRSKLRDIDTVARMGGDEFAILLPAVNDKHATMAARMLLQALRTPFVVGEQNLDIGASIGVALYPDHGVDANILIQRADVAMYAAKHANTGHAFYDGKLDQHNPTRLTLLGELRHAVEQEQFVLYFQPKVNLKTYQVTGVEALVRWNHPREDLMLPDTFIPLLEQTGMIRSLTPWVMNESLRQGQVLQDQGAPITISMNLSVRDLQDPYLADAFAEQLAALQISPRWLELEITESAVMTEPERALEVLTRLSTMGLRIAIDDFGTGYSSLSYLKKLPVNTIKIDKSFVIGMGRDENDAAIVRTSIDLAHNLKLEVVAEGVENEETLKRLAELGCDTAQGHYISRPLTADDLALWLKQSSWGITKRNPKLVRLHQ